MKNTCSASLVVIGVAITWTAGTQLARIAAGGASGPFFSFWFATCWMTLAFPFSLLLLRLLRFLRIIKHQEQNERKYDKKTLRTFFLRACGFYFLWLGANYVYVRGLIISSGAVVVAIFRGASPLFVLLLSLVFLRAEQKRSRTSKLLTFLAVALAITGVVLLSVLSNASAETKILAPILIVISAFFASTYEVLFKRLLGDATLKDVTLHLSFLGLFNAVGFWWIWLVLDKTGAEPIEFQSMSWGVQCLSSVIGFLFNVLINFGIAISSPLFVALGTTLGIPLNFIVDIIFYKTQFSAGEFVGAALVMIGVCVEVIARARTKESDQNGKLTTDKGAIADMRADVDKSAETAKI